MGRLWGRRGGAWRPGTDLEGTAGRTAGPPPGRVLQLHLRAQFFLVFLHDVREVGPPAALRVVLVSMATVWLGRRRGCRWRGSSSTREYPGPLLAGPPLLCPLLSSESCLGVWVRGAHPRGEGTTVLKPVASWDGRQRTSPGLPTLNPDGARQRPLGLLAGQNARGLTRHTGKHRFSGYRQPLQLRGWTKAQATGRKLRWQHDSRPPVSVYVASRVREQRLLGGRGANAPLRAPKSFKKTVQSEIHTRAHTGLSKDSPVRVGWDPPPCGVPTLCPVWSLTPEKARCWGCLGRSLGTAEKGQQKSKEK